MAGALKWAASPVVGGASLLFLATDCQGEQAVGAHAAIVEICRAEGKGPAEAVWTAALEAAGIANDSEAVGRIGFRAHTDGNVSTAARAWAMVTAIDDAATEWLRQAAAFSERRGDPTAETPPRKRLLELTEPAYGPDHPEVALTLTDLGRAWGELGQPAKARELLERALRINERAFGPDHPEVAATLTNLGNPRLKLGQPAKARELLERALRINERAFGPDHPQVAGTLTNLGGVWSELGQPAKAREALERALRTNERAFGPDDPRWRSPSPIWGPRGASWGSRPRPASCLSGRCASTSGNLGPTTPRWRAPSTIWEAFGASWASRPRPASCTSGRCAIFHMHFPGGHPRIDILAHNMRAVAPDVIVLDDGRIIGRAERKENSGP